MLHCCPGDVAAKRLVEKDQESGSANLKYYELMQSMNSLIEIAWWTALVLL